IGQAWDHLVSHPDRNDAVTLARDFGGQPSNFGAGVSWDIRFGHLDAFMYGVVKVSVTPNAALETWAHTANGDVTNLTGTGGAGPSQGACRLFGRSRRDQPRQSELRDSRNGHKWCAETL